MVKEIRIYIEGGGEGHNTKAQLRKGFKIFMADLVKIAHDREIELNLIMCGGRSEAFKNFKNALKSHPDSFNILLVDSEAPVKSKHTSWKHLKSRDNWDSPGVDDTHCYLMVQTMEAWLIADINALKEFYGKGFKENLIPKNFNVETIDKDNLESSLKAATRDTSKGEYHKIEHADKLLEKLDVAKVRKAAFDCKRLFDTLTQIMGA